MRTPGNEADNRAREDVETGNAGHSTRGKVASAVAKPAAVATAGLLLAAGAGLAAPATAAAETKQVRCGGTVTVEPGDRVQGITALGVPLDLGVVTDTVGSLLDGVCKVTVNVVDTAVRPVPEVGDPVADGVNDAVDEVTSGAKRVTDTVGGREAVVPDPGEDADEPADPGDDDANSGSGSDPGSDPGSGSGNGNGSGSGNGAGGDSEADHGASGTREPNSPVVAAPGSGSSSGGAGGPSAMAAPAAVSPQLRYAGIPVAQGADFDTAPGLRYGGQIPGYNPEFGVLGSPDGSGNTTDGAERNAGNSEAVPDRQAAAPARENADLRTAGEAASLPSAAGDNEGGPSMPLLLAVLALASVSAGLVRTWVLRRASVA
ncbi:hypothetical protein GCM10009676_41350 [Prauserella halophila]|uniref:Uncharacterized protein n=1 Tax=Prauserella halophila TaxID=185641 RepID=A0ABP4H909_9PSEU|nr:hypothetical protein [Prauserella halophila]MCP2236711.1 hypothetical protein [Prauserella halophila]